MKRILTILVLALGLVGWTAADASAQWGGWGYRGYPGTYYSYRYPSYGYGYYAPYRYHYYPRYYSYYPGYSSYYYPRYYSYYPYGYRYSYRPGFYLRFGW